MTTNTATHLLTPPQREAVIELANAWADWTLNWPPGYERARRLLNAQDKFGIELINRDTLLSYLNQEAA